MPTKVIILAAGQGKRMHSSLPKVLHQLAGKPLLTHVIETAHSISKDEKPIIIYGHEGDQLLKLYNNQEITFIEQKTQSGTGHAVLQALPQLSETDRVLILYGDVPLIAKATLETLINKTAKDEVGIITAHLDHPHGYGRVIRDAHGSVTHIKEEKDANEKERHINEVNSGIYFVPAKYLKKWLPELTVKNAQGEYYLTDIIEKAVTAGVNIVTVHPEHKDEISGVNDRAQLSHLERFYQRRAAYHFMKEGVTILDPERFDIRGNVKFGKDVIVDINVIFAGEVTIGDNCYIGANSCLKDAVLGNQVEIRPNSMIEGAVIANDCIIGPYARLRPGTELATGVHIGNFVEVKKSKIGAGTKANHLTYIGDSEIGKRVNVGAGTITCNYDGVNKHKTRIGDDVFIGSGTQLVAPVTIGDGATIGAGATIIKDAPARQLTVTSKEQKTIAGWARQDKIQS